MLIAISAIVVHALAPPQAPSLSGGGRRPCGGLAKADAQNLTAHSKEDWAARMYGWAVGELAGRRLPASPEQLEEEERDNAYTTRRGSSRSFRCAGAGGPHNLCL